VNVLLWHLHGSWTTAFVQGSHRVVLPVVPDRGPAGRGRARTWDWPPQAVERTPEELADEPIDVVVVQRPEHEVLARRWLGGRRPGRDLPLVWLEHDAPQGRINELRHPAADRRDLTLVHVTHTNALFWDAGRTPVEVIEHGIVDPGLRYRGALPRAGVVINEAVRRARVAGTDLLPRFARAAPIDLFGMGATDAAAALSRGDGPLDLRGYDDLAQHRLHDELADRRVYLHPYRWTSLGLALVEAMHLGMPVVALAVTEGPEAVPRGAGIVSNRLDRLDAALRHYVAEPEAAREAGLVARRSATERYGLERFLDDWDRLLTCVVADHHRAVRRRPADPVPDAARR
jgi:hypothetical protein